MDIDESRWHWAEGNRYAAEAIKTLLTLNGGAAIALLAFLKGIDLVPAGGALAAFAFGSLFAALAFGGAYFTQLAYGSGHRSTARRLHLCVFGMFGLAAAAFLTGIWLAWGSITDYRHKAQLSRPDTVNLWSGLIDQSQKMTAAAMQMADMNVCAHRS